ncbi:MAG: sugar phosphate isomerase/epimerase [Chitinophagaceae bacterium]
MRIIIVTLLMCFVFKDSFSQKIKNDFFTLHNIIRGDSTYNTYDKQVELIKNTGYAGMEINSEDMFDEMKASMDTYKLPSSYFYVRIRVDTPHMDSRLEGFINKLKGTKTIIATYIVGSTQFPADSHGADTMVIRLLKQVSDWAGNAGLQVAIYPHFGYYIQRTDNALALIKSIRRENLGLTFNLCHWLATTSLEERNGLQSHLKELSPYLKMITISGANNVITQKTNIWDDYILPLGSGSFDTYGLLKYCLSDLKLKVPVGVQCFNIKTDKYQLVKHTMSVWNEYKQSLEAAK